MNEWASVRKIMRQFLPSLFFNAVLCSNICKGLVHLWQRRVEMIDEELRFSYYELLINTKKYSTLLTLMNSLISLFCEWDVVTRLDFSWETKTQHNYILFFWMKIVKQLLKPKRKIFLYFWLRSLKFIGLIFF